MGQAERPTCSHCGAQLILALPPGGKGPRTLQCFECDGPDPLKTDKATGWLKASYIHQSEAASSTDSMQVRPSIVDWRVKIATVRLPDESQHANSFIGCYFQRVGFARTI